MRSFDWTDDAASLIRDLVGDAGLRAGAGLRMALHPPHGSLRMSVAPSPAAADRVLSRDGVRVFLCPTAERRLGARTLDAQVTAPTAFYLRDR
jgi:hypothetical protein